MLKNKLFSDHRLFFSLEILLMPKTMPHIPPFHWITRSWVWGPHSCPLHTQLPTQHVGLCWLHRWLLLVVLSGSHAQYTLCYRAVNLHWGDRWCQQGSGEGEGEREKKQKRPMSMSTTYSAGVRTCRPTDHTHTQRLCVLRSACPQPAVWSLTVTERKWRDKSCQNLLNEMKEEL